MKNERTKYKLCLAIDSLNTKLFCLYKIILYMRDRWNRCYLTACSTRIAWSTIKVFKIVVRQKYIPKMLIDYLLLSGVF